MYCPPPKRSALDFFPPSARLLIDLHFYREIGYKECADILGLRHAAVERLIKDIKNIENPEDISWVFEITDRETCELFKKEVQEP